MYKTLKPDFIGRDGFIEVFMDLGYRVKKVKNYVRTTIPTHLKYPNLIEGMCIYKKNQVWQTDITYFYLHGKFYYIIFKGCLLSCNNLIISNMFCSNSPFHNFMKY